MPHGKNMPVAETVYRMKIPLHLRRSLLLWVACIFVSTSVASSAVAVGVRKGVTTFELAALFPRYAFSSAHLIVTE
jgi:hypothetical protein